MTIAQIIGLAASGFGALFFVSSALIVWRHWGEVREPVVYGPETIKVLALFAVVVFGPMLAIWGGR